MNKNGLISFILAIAVALTMLAGCSLEMDDNFGITEDDIRPVVDDPEILDVITTLAPSATDGLACYSDGFDFVGSILCRVYEYEAGELTGRVAVSIDAPWLNYYEKDGKWYQRIFEDGGGSFDEAVEPMVSYSDAVAHYEGNVAYDKLSDDDKAIYDEMYTRISGVEDFRYDSEKHSEDELYHIENIYFLICEDHPELRSFCRLAEDHKDDVLAALYPKYEIVYDSSVSGSDAVRAVNNEFEAVCDEIVEEMPEGLSTYAKYLYLAERLTALCDYDYESESRENVVHGPYAAVLNGKAVCYEYSEAYCVLCRKADLYCATVTGTVNGAMHGWNLIALEEGTYHVDLTWADTSGNAGDFDWMIYFALTQDEILTDHPEITDGTVATGTVSFHGGNQPVDEAA